MEGNFFIQYESSKKNLSREEFFDNYIKSIDYYEENSLYLKTVFSYIDKLQKEISDYITDDIDDDGLYNALKHYNLI